MTSALMLFAMTAAAAEPPPNARAAVDKGVAYLRQRFATGTSSGGGTGGREGGHALGEAALAGLAMLEGGAPANDPTVQRIAATVRPACLPDTQTYHTALCVLFLDRLGEPSDRGLIQVLGVKLYLGLTGTGGWGYNCGDPLDASLVARLQDVTLATKPGGGKSDKPPPAGFVKPAGPKERAEPQTGLHPLADQLFKAAQSRIRGNGGRSNEPGDNSNTQFGLIGLWVAARNGLPADDAFQLIERRFLTSQNRDAGWAYTPGDNSASTPAMTCAGLLGLAVGAGRGSTTPVDRSKSTPPAGPGDGFVPTAPKKKDKEGDELEGVKNKRAVSAALAALSTVVRSSGGGQLGNFVGVGNEYYLLWSVERVCMAYNLRELGGTDWYQWGCDFLLPAQQADGGWPAVGLCSADVDTSFAILFLMKSNVVSDLSAKLGGSDRVMKAGGDNGLPPITAPRTTQKPKPPADAPPDPLMAATDAEFAVRLNALRDAPAGSANTQALVQAIGRVTCDRQATARTALAERLARMTAKTLQGMMQPMVDEEYRRAAATATALKGEKSLLPELVGLITDSADAVTQAARESLKKLTSQDHGPPPGADDTAKTKAQEAWRAALK